MAVKSIIDILVNDEAFKRFQASFNKYKEALAATPAAWNKAAEGTDKTSKNTGKTRTEAEKAATAFRNLSNENAKLSRHAETQARSWKDIAKSAHTFAGHIVDATRSLMRWAGLTGIIGGILGVGGLFGIERLAAFAGNQRAQGLALGMKPSDAKAFETNLGARGYDSNSFLGNINKGMMDLQSPQFRGLRMALGADFNPRGKDTADVAAQTLAALKTRIDEIPLGPMFEPMARARQLDSLMDMEDLQRLRRTPAAEVNDYAKNIQSDRAAMNLPDATAKAWQDLQSMFTRSATILKNMVIDKLVGLAEPLGHLSEAFTKVIGDLLSRPELKQWIEDLAAGVKWFGDYLMSDRFHNQVTRFIDGVEKFAVAIWDFVELVIEGVSSLKKWLHPLDAAKTDENGNSPLYQDDPATHPKLNKNLEESGQWWHDLLHPWQNNNRTWWLPYGGRQDVPDAAVQKQTFDQLEGQKQLPHGIMDAVFDVESSRGRKVLNPDGGAGPFQFMGPTWQTYGKGNPFNFNDSSNAASSYLHKLYEEFNHDVAKTIAGYNAGEGNVEDAVKRYGADWERHLPHPEITSPYIDRVYASLGMQRGGQNQAGLFPGQGRVPRIDVNINNNVGANVAVASNQVAQ